MKYQYVCIESIGYALPEEVLSSAEIERRLAPLYARLKLPEGRLELMTGIRERRLWPAGTLPSAMSVQCARRAIDVAAIDRREIGALVHGSVCRDHLEPATACAVHHGAELPRKCLIYDVSNACLGLLDGILQVANMIELGQIRAGLVVGSEGSRELVENTIATLNADMTLTRESVKRAIASLTIGSAGAAVLVVHESMSKSGTRLLGATARSNTEQHGLCHNTGRDEAVAGGMRPLMQTDSETLLREGVAIGREAFGQFLDELGWTPADVHKTVFHQVGSAHSKMILDSFGLKAANDFVTYPWLGNTGAAAVPVTLAIGSEQGQFQRGDRVTLLGIGSGINVLMLGLRWENVMVSGGTLN